MYKLNVTGCATAGLPPMTDPLDIPAVPVDDSRAEDVAVAALGTNLTSELRTRVVREARRETWFIVNEGSEDLATIPVDLRSDGSLRRVDVNGEASEFSAGESQVLVRPRRALRAGSGTIVVLHFR